MSRKDYQEGMHFADLSRTSSGEHYRKKTANHRRRFVASRVAIIAVVVLAVGAAAAFAYVANISSRLKAGLPTDINSALTAKASSTEPFYMLLMGVDKSAERAQSSEYGPSDADYRTDSIILVRIDPKNKTCSLVSIHRDTWVDLGGSLGKQKINAAYSAGGPTGAVKEISKFAGVPITHYAEVDFDNFTKIVDQIGGIEVDVKRAINDPQAGVPVPAGHQKLNGAQALALSRSRHSYDDSGDGDQFRASNQRMVIGAIVKKVLTLDAATMASTISTMADSITTDMDVQTILGLANSMRGIDLSKSMYTGMEPTDGHYANNTWFEIVELKAWQTMMGRVDAGLSPYSSAAQDNTAGKAGDGAVVSDDNGVTAEPLTKAGAGACQMNDATGQMTVYDPDDPSTAIAGSGSASASDATAAAGTAGDGSTADSSATGASDTTSEGSKMGTTGGTTYAVRARS